MPRLHSQDNVSVEMLVRSLSDLSDSPVLHYNPIDEEYCLIMMTEFQKHMIKDFPNKICVDGTYGLNAYKYTLLSIVVIDEYENGIPVAFCFTKKTDYDATKLFFDVV